MAFRSFQLAVAAHAATGFLASSHRARRVLHERAAGFCHPRAAWTRLAGLLVVALMSACGPKPMPPTVVLDRPDTAQVTERLAAAVGEVRDQLAEVDDIAASGAIKAPELSSTFWTPIQLAATSSSRRLEGAVIDTRAGLVAEQAKADALQATIENLNIEVARLQDEDARHARKVLFVLMAVGIVLFALGAAGLFFIPAASMKWLGGMAAVTGGILAVTCLVFGSAITSLVKAMPWLVGTGVGVLCLLLLAGGAVLLLRLYKYERDTGSRAQDELIDKGDTAGAAALAFAQKGGGDAGWEAAKLIELSPLAPDQGSGRPAGKPRNPS